MEVVIKSGEADGVVRFWKLNSGRQITGFQANEGTVNCVQFSTDGLTLASAGDDRKVRLWNINTGHLIATLSGHSS